MGVGGGGRGRGGLCSIRLPPRGMAVHWAEGKGGGGSPHGFLCTCVDVCACVCMVPVRVPISSTSRMLPPPCLRPPLYLPHPPVWFDGGLVSNIYTNVSSLLNQLQPGVIAFNGAGFSMSPIRWVGTGELDPAQPGRDMMDEGLVTT